MLSRKLFMMQTIFVKRKKTKKDLRYFCLMSISGKSVLVIFFSLRDCNDKNEKKIWQLNGKKQNLSRTQTHVFALKKKQNNKIQCEYPDKT